MKKNNYLLPLLLAIALIAGLWLGSFLQKKINPTYSSDNQARVKINRLMDLIETDYVDDVDTDAVVDLAINNILGQLDPHSVYINQDELGQVEQSMKGSFVGIGITFNIFNDTLAVIKSLPEGPAKEAGIEAGDRILYAGNQKIFGNHISSDSITEVLRGEQDSSIDLKIFRKKNNTIFNTKVTRKAIPIKSVDVAVVVRDTIGYIKVNRFSETTHTEFADGLDKLIKRNIKTLIVDLRDNGGGYMEPAIQIADEFLPLGRKIVKVINKKGKESQHIATEGGMFEKGQLFVLINENTASSSEIIAGAVQDNDRGTIIGRRSYGKGLVQREIYLGDGSAVRLTTARYYTPSGRSIQKPYHESDSYQTEIAHRFETGELYERDSIHLADSLQFRTLKGRIVYGGGGIVPDVFVPVKNKHGEDAIQLLMKTAMISHFVFQQIDTERNQLEKLSSQEIADRLSENPMYFDELKVYLKENGLTFNLDRHKQNILFYLTAEYINQLKTADDYYLWLLQQDPMVEKSFS